MQKRLISYALLAASTASSAVIRDVKDSLARNDLRARRCRGRGVPEAVRRHAGNAGGSLVDGPRRAGRQGLCACGQVFRRDLQTLPRATEASAARSGASSAGRARRCHRGAGKRDGRPGRTVGGGRLPAAAVADLSRYVHPRSDPEEPEPSDAGGKARAIHRHPGICRAETVPPSPH